MRYGDFLKATAGISKNVVKEKRDNRQSLDTCPHKNVRDVHYKLVIRLKGESKLYEAFCDDCRRIVYGQTGANRIPWTTNKDVAYSEEAV
jgi:hypothetical protein